MKITGINHIGLAPKDPQKARWFLGTVLGLNHKGDELVLSQATNTGIFASKSASAHQESEALLEILEHQEGQEGPIRSYLEKKGGGIHHLALTVDNIEEAIQHLLSHKIELLHHEAQPGVCQTRIVFVHPRSTGGLLIELVENP